MSHPLFRVPVVLLALIVVGCAAAPTPRATESAGQPPAQSSARITGTKTLTMAVRYEVTDLAAKRVAGGPSSGTKRAFNAALALTDGTGTVRPYLAESLPQLNTDSWKVASDGKMETTYRLKPNLTWHDGQPLTAEDFAFAYRVYTQPGLGVFNSKPQDQIDEILTPDARTLLIRWKGIYAEAGALGDGDLDPLPRHILEGPEIGTPESLSNWNLWDWEIVR